MEELRLELHTANNVELDQYLSDSMFRYGLEQVCGNHPKKFYGCYRDATGELVAGVMGTAMTNLFFISHLFVEAEYRNSGLGSRLLKEIETIARQAGCDIIRLNTLNKRACRFYSKAGFTETARISGYMNGFDLTYFHKQIG